jgi:hypothetical protein
VLIGTTSIRLFKDNHDSWGTCTTYAKCKTIITAALMVISGMDPHMISGNMRWVMVKSWVGLGCVKEGLLGCDSVMVRLRDAIEIVIFEQMSLLPYY